MNGNYCDFLNHIKVSEHFNEELYNWTPISIDFDSLNDLLDNKQLNLFVQNQNCEIKSSIVTDTDRTELLAILIQELNFKKILLKIQRF